MYCAFGIMAAAFMNVNAQGAGMVVDAAIVDGATSLMSFFFGSAAGRPFITTRAWAGNVRRPGLPAFF